MCLCGKAIESRTHVVGECEMYKEEQDVLEKETREIDECDMDNFSSLDDSEETIATLRDRRWPQKAKQEGDTVSIYIYIWNTPK